MADKYNNWLAKILNILFGTGHEWAITLSKDCCRYSCSEAKVNEKPKWRKHEECHKRQIAELGVWKFYKEYIKQWYKEGYINISFEVEAREAEKKKLVI